MILLLFLLLSISIQAQKELSQLSYDEIDSIMYAFYEEGAYEKAIPYLKAGREKSLKEFGNQDTIFASYNSDLAFFYEKIGQYHQALPLYLQAIEIEKKTLGPDHPDFAASLNNLAALYNTMGKYEEALALFIQVKTIFENTQEPDSLDIAVALNNIANVYCTMKQYELALPLYIESKNTRERLLGKNHPDYSESLNNLADLYKKTGNYELALSFFKQAVEIDKKKLGKDHPLYAVSLNNLAIFYQDFKKYDDAIPFLLEGISIRKKALGIGHPSYASSLVQLAQLYQEIGKTDLAMPLFLQAKDIYEKTIDKENILYSAFLGNLSKFYIAINNQQEAWKYLEQAVRYISNKNISLPISNLWIDSLSTTDFSSSIYMEHLIGLLKIIYPLLDGDKAKQSIILNIGDALFSKLQKQHTNDKDKLRILDLAANWVFLSLNLLDEKQDVAKAFELADQSKSVLLLEATKEEKAYQLGEIPDSLIQVDKELIKKRNQLEANLLEKRPTAVKDSLRKVLIETNLKIENFKKTIQKQYPKYAQFKYQKNETKYQDIQQNLDDNTAIIEYMIGKSVTHIFYLDKTNIRWVKQDIDRLIFNEKVQKFHTALSNYKAISSDASNAYKKYTELSYWFYQNLLEPILEKNSNIKNLVIIPDRELGHLPFEAFLVQLAPQKQTDYPQLQYLINNYSISYNYSATLWKENMTYESTRSQNGEILAMSANYDIKIDSDNIDKRLPTDIWTRNNLIPLPAARKEVEVLQEEFSGFFAFDKEASEKVFKEKASGYSVIHLAMHGLLNAKSPILSSLAFTEDGNSLENNFLQAYEISKMELNTELVVLSACETGYGKFERGNGIASLARAFMYAGAPALIVSLWQVSDYATSEIMKKFYHYLAKGMKKDEALREAKVDYLKNAKGIMAHPAFWSPFILMGNTKPVYLKSKSNGYWAWIIGGGIILIGIGAIYRKFRMNSIEK